MVNKFQLGEKVQSIFDRFISLTETNPNGKILIGELDLDEEEVSLILDSFRHYMSGGDETGFRVIKSIFGLDGFYFLSCVLFAKYRYADENENGFRPAISDWIETDSQRYGEPKNPMISEEFKFFHKRYGVFLYRSHGNSRDRCNYVSSFYTNAIIPRNHVGKVLDFLKLLARLFPFRMDKEKQDDILTEILYEAAKTIDDDTISSSQTNRRKSKVSARTSWFLQLPRGFRRACEVNPAAALHAIQPLFSALQMVASSVRNNQEVDEVELPVDWYLREPLQEYIENWIKELANQSGELKKRKPSRWSYRTPDFLLDLEHMQLKLYIPEQTLRYSEDLRGVTIEVTGKNTSHSIDLELFLSQGIFACSEPTEIALTEFPHEMSCVLFSNAEQIKKFPNCGVDDYLVFDAISGEIIRNKCQTDQEVIVVVEANSDFDADFAELVYTSGDGWKAYQLTANESGRFILNDKLISLTQEVVPQWELHQGKKVKSVSVELPDKSILPVFSGFPRISFRMALGEYSSEKLPLLVNGLSRDAIVLNCTEIEDGSGDSLYTLNIAEHELPKVRNSILRVSIGGLHDFEQSFVVLQDIRIKFTAPYYQNKSDVRIAELFFRDCETLFTGHYEFPMHHPSTRFYSLIDDQKMAVCIDPPIISWYFADSKSDSIPEKLHVRDIRGKKLIVTTPYRTCRVEAKGSESERVIAAKGKKLDDKQFEFDLDTIAGNLTEDADLIMRTAINTDNPVSLKIAHLYIKFILLDEPTFMYEDGDSRQRAIHTEGSGQYIHLSFVGSEKETYSLEVESTNSCRKSTAVIQGGFHNFYSLRIGDEPLQDGDYTLRIFRRRMGMGSGGLDAVVTCPHIVIRHGQLFSPSLLLGETIEVKELIKREHSNNSTGTTTYNVKNFLLHIVDHVQEDDCLLAYGYFMINDSKKEHSLFNPYKLSNIKKDDKKIIFTIHDNRGDPVGVTRFGAVNHLNAEPVAIGTKMLGIVKQKGK